MDTQNSTNKLTEVQKQQLKNTAEQHIHDIQSKLQAKIHDYDTKQQAAYDLIPELEGMDVNKVSPDSEARDQAIARIKLYHNLGHELEVIKESPYFARIDMNWEDGEKQSLYISKYSMIEENIFSWVTPIATLRYSELGHGEYAKPSGTSRGGDIDRKDDFMITNGEIAYMTHTSKEQPRQVVFQKHFNERRSFLLPEIVAELDKLQDQIIRSNPKGGFLISGPAGSGKTTLALHRIAYLVLTPDFKDFFEPERIMVFVADEGAIRYFSNLLPELGINGVKITTFNEWSLMIVNSRFRASRIEDRFKFLPNRQALEFVAEQKLLDSIHPQLALDEIRKYKQQLIMPIIIKEGSNKEVFSKLNDLYLAATDGLDPEFVTAVKKYLSFQKKNRYLDEVDIIILLRSLERHIKSFAHVVVDEVQNWLPAQLEFITNLADRRYYSISYIGDIRQKTKAFSIGSWDELSEGKEVKMQHAELLKVYRNTKQILKFLADKKYDVEVAESAREGEEVEISTLTQKETEDRITLAMEVADGNQVGVLAKYQNTLDEFEHMGYENDNLHVLTVSEAQGLEFHTVILIGPEEFETNVEDYQNFGLGAYSSYEYSEQDRHLLYVAATRAQEQLVLVTKK